MVKVLYWIQMAIKIIFRCVEIVAFILASCMCLNWLLSGHDTLEEGCERIERITGYPISSEHSQLILHKTNESNSIVIVEDFSSEEKMKAIMEQLVATDERWTAVSISQKDAHEHISRQIEEGQIPSYAYFRVICDIEDGDFDYIYVDNPHGGDADVCLVDVDTQTIALYIYLSGPSFPPLFPPFL